MAPPAGVKDNSFAKLPVGAKLGLLVLLVGVIGAVYYFALHMPLADEIAASDQRYLALQNDLVQARARQQEYLRVRAELDSRESLDRQNMRILPEHAEIPAFLQDLNRLAELSGLRMTLVEPRPEETSEFYVRLPVTLELAGRYHQLAKFFFNVSRLERAINMENIELGEPHQDGEDIVLKVGALATTFRRPAAPAAAPAGQTAPAGGQPGAVR